MPDYFNKYNAQLLYIEQNDSHISNNDLNNDGKIETIGLRVHQNYYYLEILDENNLFIGQYLLENCEDFVKTLWINDYDEDGYKEIYFFTIKKDSLFLNIFDAKKMDFYKKDIFITKVRKNRTGEYDMYSKKLLPFYDNNKDGFPEFYFFLDANFSYFPRGVFAYDIKNDTLLKSEYVGAHILANNIVETKNQTFIPLSSHTTSNYRDEFSYIPYPDTSGWLMVLNTDLDFIFPPVEYKGSGNNVFPYILQTENDVFICALITNNQKELYALVKYDLEGNLLSEKTLKFKRKPNQVVLMTLYQNSEPSKVKLLSNDGYMYVYNEDLELINDYKLTDLKYNKKVSFREVDINLEGSYENIIVHDKGVDIFTSDFKHKTTLPMNDPDFIDESIIYGDENNAQIKIRNLKINIWYVFEYNKNTYYPFKFLLYMGIYISVLLILFLIFRLREIKLKADNLKLQKIIADNVKDLKEQNEKILELSEFKEGLTSMIVHDLKNPLNIILNSKNINTVMETAQEMNLLVMNILDVQKMENIQINLNLKHIQLQHALNSAVRSITYLLEQKSLTLKLNIYSGVFVKADEELLKRVFINLLTNAIKYSPNNEEIVINNEIIDDFVKITITDKGTGIPKDKLNIVFEKFSQFKARNIGRLKSTGIGLNFCKLAIEAHSGQIGINSDEGKGASFWIALKISKKEKTANYNISSKEISNIKTYDITAEEYKILLPFAKKFNEYEMYEYTDIMNLINQIKPKKNKNVQLWVNEIEKAVKSSNEKKYSELVTAILNYK